MTIRLDRTMDFVQLKDQRGACFEPIGSLSGYRWSNGLGYYAEVEDAATNFFFDHLGKGVYVLEYSYRVSVKELTKQDWPLFSAHTLPNTLHIPHQ